MEYRVIFNQLIIAMIMSALASTVAQAEIYKWQDEKGNWHFSDSAVGAKGKPTRVQSYDSKNTESGSQNLSEKLELRYRPDSTVERVTLSVIGIETALGQGSGFFVSEEGHH